MYPSCQPGVQQASARVQHWSAGHSRRHARARGELRQPVQQRGPNEPVPGRTTADAAGLWPAQTAHPWTIANPANVTGGLRACLNRSGSCAGVETSGAHIPLPAACDGEAAAKEGRPGRWPVDCRGPRAPLRACPEHSRSSGNPGSGAEGGRRAHRDLCWPRAMRTRPPTTTTMGTHDGSPSGPSSRPTTDSMS
jgi:hypothetical protein